MSALRCPVCGHVGCRVTNNRYMPADSYSVCRGRECDACGARFRTVETGHYDDDTWADYMKIQVLKRRQLTPEEESRLLSRALDSLGEIVMQEGISVPLSFRQQHADALAIAMEKVDAE